MVGFPISSRLTQGPAVSVADRHHSLRLDMLTMRRSVYLQVRCAVVALWSEHETEYAPGIRLATAKLDSFLPTLSDLAQLDERSAVQRRNLLCLVAPVHKSAEVLPGLNCLLPVLDDASR